MKAIELNSLNIVRDNNNKDEDSSFLMVLHFHLTINKINGNKNVSWHIIGYFINP